MFGSSLPPVVCRRAQVLFTLFVFVCVKRCPTHIVMYCVFMFCLSLSSSCVPNVASFSGLSILDCPFGFLSRLFTKTKNKNISIHGLCKVWVHKTSLTSTLVIFFFIEAPVPSHVKRVILHLCVRGIDFAFVQLFLLGFRIVSTV